MHLTKKNLYLVAYTINFFGMVLYLTSVPCSDLVKKICTLFSAAILTLITLCTLNNKYRIKQSGFPDLFVVLSLLGFTLLNRDYFMLILLLFFLTSDVVDEKMINKIFSISAFITVLVSCLAIFLCILNFIPNVNTPRGWMTADRYAWGFTHSQISSILILYVEIYLIIAKQKCSILTSILFGGIMYLNAYIFDARNAFYTILIYFILIFLTRLSSQIIGKIYTEKIVNFMSCIAPTLAVVSSLALLKLYERGNRIADLINYILSNRIWCIHKNLSMFSIKAINIITYEEFSNRLITALDHSYYYILLRYGYVMMILVVIAIYFISNYYYRQDNIYGCLAVIVISVSLIVTNTLTGCYFLPFWVVALRELYYKIYRIDKQKYDE